MKKSLFFIAFLLISAPLLAQEGDIVGTWYLNGFTADLDETIYISPFGFPQDPTLTINSDLSFEGIFICNTYSGTYIDISGSVYEHIDFMRTTDECNAAEYENSFFKHFDDTLSETSLVYFVGEFLEVEYRPGFGLQFQSTPFLTEPELSNTWYLTEYHNDLEEDLDIASIDPPISPNLVIDENLVFVAEAACNTFSGKFVLDSNGESYNIEDFEKTTNTCTDPEHIQFETDYEAVLVGGGNLFFDTNGTTNGDEYLRASNQIFGFMNFRNTPLLGTTENNLIDFKIFPNPVSSELNIVSANETIESVVVFNLSGSKILISENNIQLIDVSSLANGLYFIQVTSEERTSIKKFIKQ